MPKYDHNRKPDPVRYCATCGKRLRRKRYQPSGLLESMRAFMDRATCGQMCMGYVYRGLKPSTAGDRQKFHTYARKLCPPGPCRSCGKKRPTEDHHKDGDWTNNQPSKLERLCSKCHKQEHKRIRTEPATHVRPTPSKSGAGEAI